MTEDEAVAYVEGVAGVDDRLRIAAFVDMVREENDRQNLIARSSVDEIWARHVADSVQLMSFAPPDAGLWVDIGTGGGFPGMIVGLLRHGRTILVEPRRRRAEFLTMSARRLKIDDRVEVAQTHVEKLTLDASVISARAVASIENLLPAASACATPMTRWILPRGQVDPSVLARLSAEWEFLFHVEHSLTDDRSAIVILDGVKAR